MNGPGVSGASLRARLALLGLIGVVVPLLVLLAVSAWTQEEVKEFSDGTSATSTAGLSAWVPITVGILVIPAAVASWWWAGREVRLQERLAGTTAVQRQLLEDASHQLRTPLAVLLTNAEVTLADPSATETDLREALLTTRQTAERMRLVVEDLLSDARARQGASSAGADLAAIADRTCATYRNAAAARGVRVRRTGVERLPLPVDGAAIARAVDALVDNAVRHSPAGSEVLVEVARENGSAVLAVTDAGPGIPAADQPHVFERYWTTAEGHSGIGLAIVAQVAAAHGGVQIDSPHGPAGGTQVRLRFRSHA